MNSLSPDERQLLANLILKGQQIPSRYAAQLLKMTTPLELIWKGKQKNPPPPPQPFECREGTPQASSSFFMGDNSEVMATLLSPSWQQRITELGGLQLIYIDPPFDVGSVFHQKRTPAATLRTKKHYFPAKKRLRQA